MEAQYSKKIEICPDFGDAFFNQRKTKEYISILRYNFFEFS